MIPRSNIRWTCHPWAAGRLNLRLVRKGLDVSLPCVLPYGGGHGAGGELPSQRCSFSVFGALDGGAFDAHGLRLSDFNVLSKRSEGTARLQAGGNGLILGWEAGWDNIGDKARYEGQLLYERYVNVNLGLLTGMRVSRSSDAATEKPGLSQADGTASPIWWSPRSRSMPEVPHGWNLIKRSSSQRA